MDRMYGVVVGLVMDVDDPESQGRIKVRYPWLAPDGNESGWAPIASPMSGKDRGYFYLPEVDDEALIAFEQGDINHPMVLGFLHNGVDEPPFSGIDRHVRRVKSVAGHKFELDDRSGKESIRLRTHNGHQLELHDPGGYVEAHSSGGHKIRIDDTLGQIALTTAGQTQVTLDDTPSSITLQTAGGVVLTISDAGGVTVTAVTGGVTVNTLNANVTAAAAVTITAPQVTVDTAMLSTTAAMANFAGVVQCSTLITESVVSTSYTPGAGNLW